MVTSYEAGWTEDAEHGIWQALGRLVVSASSMPAATQKIGATTSASSRSTSSVASRLHQSSIVERALVVSEDVSAFATSANKREAGYPSSNLGRCRPYRRRANHWPSSLRHGVDARQIDEDSARLGIVCAPGRDPMFMLCLKICHIAYVPASKLSASNAICRALRRE
jgi:hypothetical protein